MDDDISRRINLLVDEEHELLSKSAHTDDDHARIQHLEVQLDQCWDLLRQRRARRSAGLDPDDASPRSEGTVEGYQQ